MSDAMALDIGMTQHSIGREVDLVAGAIQMVAGGGAPGVTLIGLNFGPAVLERLTGAASRAGVALEPLWRPDDGRCDIRVHSRDAGLAGD